LRSLHCFRATMEGTWRTTIVRLYGSCFSPHISSIFILLMAKRAVTRQNILTFITGFTEEKGYAPTVKEIALNCGITSLSVVQYHLDRLETSGLIKREKRKARSISRSIKTTQENTVPVLGVIAAGHPIGIPETDTWDSAATRMEVPLHIHQGRQHVYALEVRGNSMVDAMIGDGDIVVMQSTSDIKNGDVVAVWLKNEQEVTLKKIYFEGERVRLQPCNPFMMPLYQDAENIEVQGKVIGVIRSSG
jgi:repressor LexA